MLPHGTKGECRSLTGAWIETISSYEMLRPSKVAPSRERGSKPVINAVLNIAGGRSLTGAWIETLIRCESSGLISVAPSRERGSKPIIEASVMSVRKSLPHGSVDRNPNVNCYISIGDGRSLTGAWIETPYTVSMTLSMLSLPHGSVDRNIEHHVIWTLRQCRSLTGAWIETVFVKYDCFAIKVAPSRERGSKLSHFKVFLGGCRSLPHGSVDRNGGGRRHHYGGRCRSLTGAWIETPATVGLTIAASVAPSRERGSKHRQRSSRCG